MKKFVSTAVAVALVGSMSTVALPTAASAQGASTAVEFCKTAVEEGSFESVGKCMKAARGNIPKLCKALEGSVIYDLFGWKNRGNCVSYIRSFQNG